MELTIKDRVIILNTAIPGYGSREDLKNLIIPITNKLKLSGEETKNLTMTPGVQGSTNVSYTADALVPKTFDFTDEEMTYLKKRIDMIDKNGMFSIDTIETYDKIIDCSIK